MLCVKHFILAYIQSVELSYDFIALASNGVFFKNIFYVYFTQVWAVSGGQRGSFGGRKGSTLLKWATPGVTPQTLSMTKCALVSPRFTLKLNQTASSNVEHT